MSETGIPVAVLFSIIGVLLIAIYTDLKKSLDRLTASGAKRDLKFERFNLTLRMVCAKLNIPYREGDHHEHPNTDP